MPKIILQVTYTHTGRVEVVGNVNNKALCYAALEMAKDVIREFHDLEVKPPFFENGGIVRLESEKDSGKES